MLVDIETFLLDSLVNTETSNLLDTPEEDDTCQETNDSWAQWTNQKTSVDEASPDYHTTLVESLINVNLTELYRVNEDQASIHRQYNIMYVFALPLGLPL